MISLLFRLFITGIFLLSVKNQASAIDIEIHCKQGSSDLVQLAYYYHSGIFLEDTLFFNGDGVTRYTNSDIQPGIYLLVFNDSLSFEFMITGNNDLNISFNSLAINNMVIGGDKQSMAFHYYLTHHYLSNRKINNMQQTLKKTSTGREEELSIRQKIKTLKDENLIIVDSLTNLYSGRLLGDYLQMTRPPEIPDTKINRQNIHGQDSLNWTERIEYYKDHYLDNINLNNSGLIRTHLLGNRISHYINHVIPQTPGELIAASDKILDKCEENKEMHIYLLSYLLNHFSPTNDKPEYNKVYLHLKQKYGFTN